MPEFEIKVGHTLDLLRAMVDESIHMICTSPPYYGLRSYEGVAPSVWGGDAACAHVWSFETVTGEMRRGLGQAESPHSTRGGGKKIARTPDIRTERGLCATCGAWRGVLGNEPTVELFIEHMVEVCREIWRVLRSDGTFWLNLGDSYAASSTSNHGRGKATPAMSGHGKEQRPGGWENPPRHLQPGFKRKDLMLVPHRVAIALQNDGWWVRMDNVWAKLNCLPEPVEDRPTKSHEYVFLLTKSESYFYDAEAVREKQSGTAHSRGKGVTPKSAGEHDPFIRAKDGNRNLRSVWSMASEPYREEHFATYPTKLPTICIKAGTSEVGVCLACGAPWERIVIAQGGAIGRSWSDHTEDELLVGHKQRNLMAKPAHAKRNGNEYTRETIGWQQTCDCPYQTPAPALVCDPFSGAGTTGLAALRLGRNYVGHEASGTYAQMSRGRIRDESPMFFTEVKSDEDTQLQAESVGR